MAYSQVILYEPLRTFDSASLSGTYQPLGTPLANAASIIKLVNSSNVAVKVSVDGINDDDILPANSSVVYEITTNRPSSLNALFVPQGRQYSVKGTAGVGLIYLVVQYVKQV